MFDEDSLGSRTDGLNHRFVESSWRQYIPDDANDVKDITFDAVWSLSSCKDGFGINQLLDDQTDLFWQSDGQQPHRVTIEFQKSTEISFLMFYLDFKTDESYTPSKIIIQAGSNAQDMDDTLALNYNEPIGWQVVDLRDKKTKRPLKAYVLTIQVQHNHQNGRDTHIRSIRVIGNGNSYSALDTLSRISKIKYNVKGSNSIARMMAIR
uniref:Anaphase-promoting complex subunit 10 n=1 Tax=Strongyloides venezuelensis TaxID=75913 RepID=A0A0K0FVC7_STRVS